MRRLAILVMGLICLVDFSSCGTTNFAPPPVTADLARTGTRQSATGLTRRGEHADLAMLREGRKLFVSRCIECHTLPPFWHYRTEDWTEIVNSMSRRANLKPKERDAIIAYILAVRAKE